MSDEEGICRECNIDRFQYQRIIRRLTEKLEYSWLQNEILSTECARLREQLKYSEWQRHSRLPFDVQNLPSEIWREIFAFATSIEGLAYSHWDNKDVKREWIISLITRRSIPLVCRAWNLAGSSFLYEHLILGRLEQLQQLEEVLTKAEDSGCGSDYRSWTRALELVPGPECDRRREFFQLAAKLLERYHFPHLTIFGIDSNIEPIEQELVLPVATTAIQTYGGQLEYLHLPATENSWRWEGVFDESLQPVLPLPHLHTFSMTPGKWVMNRSHSLQYFRALTTKTVHSALRTLSVEWFRRDKEIFFNFLRTTPQVQTLHFGKSSFWESIGELPTILELLPNLEQLYLEYAPPASRDTATNYTRPQIHNSLSKIMIQAGRTGCLDFIDTTKALFSMIEERCFPQLKVIEIQLRNFRSCVDEGIGYPEVDRDAWRRAISICAIAGVQLISPSGDLIHLWSDKHGIKRDPRVEKREERSPKEDADSGDDSEGEDTDVEGDGNNDEDQEEGGPDDSEDEGEENEYGDSDSDDVYTHSEDDSAYGVVRPGLISDDSEDAEFEFWDQPDIEIETDSDSDSPLQDLLKCMMADLRLPAELWIKIFDLATRIPSELNTEGLTFFERCSHKEAINERQKVMKTRRTLPLVSKKFYILSINFLYQSISVLRGTTLHYLRRTLQSGSGHPQQDEDISAEGVSDQKYSHFSRWVKRLDIVFRRKKFPHLLSNDPLQLLALLPRIEILTLHGDAFVPSADVLFDSIESLRELKMLHLPRGLPVSYASKLSTRLKSPESVFFSLRVLESNILGGGIGVPEQFKDSEGNVDRPHPNSIPGCNIGWIDTLHKWVSTENVPTNSNVFFPRLSTVTLFDSANIRFLKAHGHKITTVFLFNLITLFEYQQYLPNLRDVVLKTDIIYPEFPAYSSHNKVAARQVKRVGISVSREQFSGKFFSQALVDLPLYFPNMVSLRILDKRTVSYLMQPREMKRRIWNLKSMTREYRLEGEDGELLFGERGY